MDRLRRWLCLSAALGTMSLGLLLLVTVLVLTGCGELFFRRNSNLRLFRQAREGSYCLSPAWSPDGGKVYFIDGNGSGQLRVVNSDGSDNKLLLDGMFGSVRVSPDGVRLVVTTGYTSGGGKLLWLDVDGGVLDTLSPPEDTIRSVRFGKSSETLYCYIYRKGILRLDIGSRRMDTIMSANLEYWQGFDVSGDTLLALPGIVYHMLSGRSDSVPVLRQSCFCPGDPNVLLGVLGIDQYEDDLVLVDRGSGSVTHLDARPYYSCDILYPCWSPDGGNIVMSTAEMVSAGFGGGQMASTYNLWELKR